MSDKFIRFAVLVLLVIAAAYVVQPYLTAYFYSATTPRPVTPGGNLSEAERATIAVFEHTAPSVVQVIGQNGTGVQTGTGFVWDPAGHIVTNNHVVEGVTRLAVQLASGQSGPAEVVGRAPNYDLAVLRLVGSGLALPPPVTIGTSGDLQVGQFAYAIGNPFGLDQSLTTGVISALKRRLPESGGREISEAIQTDAAINPGNSGGPLLDSSGRLIGVNTAIYSPSGASAGIGFAIPIDVVNRIVPELIRAGRVPTPGIGILAADAATTAQLGIRGVVIAQTVAGLPAERAGLRGVDADGGSLGDIITAVNGKPVRRLSDLTEELARVGVGKSAQLTVQRDDATRTVDIVVADVGQR